MDRLGLLEPLRPRPIDASPHQTKAEVINISSREYCTCTKELEYPVNQVNLVNVDSLAIIAVLQNQMFLFSTLILCEFGGKTEMLRYIEFS